MIRLRPFKQCDAETVISWLQDETVFLKWGGKLFGAYPLTAERMNEKYFSQNGGCAEPDNFYPWVALDDEGNVVGQFITRYTDGNPKHLRFGWVIVDNSARGKGIGRQMLTAGLKIAFEVLRAESVTLGVFENNEPAHRCYLSVGFRDEKTVDGNPWRQIEMKICREEYDRIAAG